MFTSAASLPERFRSLADRIDGTSEEADVDGSNRYVADALREEARAIEAMPDVTLRADRLILRSDFDPITPLPPVDLRGPRGIDLSDLPTIDMNALTARAAVLRNSAATLDNLDGVEQKDLTDHLVEISPLPNWIDRYLIRIVIEALPAALAWLAERTQRDADAESGQPSA